jgi:peptidoglycan-N-acetylglucosamine deacetylase
MKNTILLLVAFYLLLSSCTNNEKFINFTYPDGKYKALIMSYDDGVIQDIQLTKLFNENGIVGTFNLNSAYLGTTRGWAKEYGDSIYQKYIPKDSLMTVYKNHEIAAHAAFHKDFLNISDNEILEELNTDISALTELTSREIKSMAYPFGNTNGHIAKVVSTTQITNARTVNDTYEFNLPTNYLIWNPTCHDSKALDYLDKYLGLDKPELSLFYVWGHSWEFGDKKRLDNIIKFCQQIGKKSDIWYVGSGPYIEYLKSLKKVEIHENEIINPSGNQSVWIQTSTRLRILKPGEKIETKTL